MSTRPDAKTTRSVLDEMTRAVRERRNGTARAAGLTPVGTEKAAEAPITSLAGKHVTMFPYDDPQTVHDAIRTGLNLVRKAKDELDHVGHGLIALAELYGLGADAVAPPPMLAQEDPEKADEREADRRAALRAVGVSNDDEQWVFEEALKAKSDAAQAATFAAESDAPADGDEAVAYTGWTCSTHGATALTQLTSRKGRKYQSCTECDEFEKG